MTWPLDHLPLIELAGRCVVAIEMQNKITASDRIIFVSYAFRFFNVFEKMKKKKKSFQ